LSKLPGIKGAKPIKNPAVQTMKNLAVQTTKNLAVQTMRTLADPLQGVDVVMNQGVAITTTWRTSI
jgi:hypothetical protein